MAGRLTMKGIRKVAEDLSKFGVNSFSLADLNERQARHYANMLTTTDYNTKVKGPSHDKSYSLTITRRK